MANPAHAIAATITRVDPALKAVEMRSMTDHIKRTLLRERLLTTLTTSLGLLGVVLVAVGVYGVVAFRAAQRTKEMGIRMALGALPHQLIRIMLTDMLVPVGIGILVGVTASLYLTRFAEGMLFGVTGTDAATLASSCGVLLLLAMVAAWLPSSRASRVSLTTTLRAD